MFVMMGGLIGGDGSQGRVAAYVVSGIGFLGGGVILKDGFSIRGLNTAATLWCTAAIGTLAGLGYTTLCFLGTAVVLAANLLLRPLAQRINRAPIQAPEEIVLYLFECICRTSDEAQIRALLLQNIGRTPLVLCALHSEDQEGTSRVKVRAHVKSTGRKDEFPEQIVTRLSLEPGVTTIRWEVVSSLDVGEGNVDDLVGNYGHLIVDECHHLSAQSFELVARRAKGEVRHGFVCDGHTEGWPPSDHLYAVRPCALSG
jgi:putative Mg2+ transporter-C (MgtC) family protein